MNIPNIGGLLTIGKSFVMANRPEILFGASVTSTVLSVIAAGRGGYKSGRQVADAEMELVMRGLSATAVTELETAINDDANKITDKKELAKLTWINYLPAAAGTLGALSATTGLHLVHVQEKKMLAAACLMAIDEVKKEAKTYEKSLKELGFTMDDNPAALEAVADEDGIAKLVHGDGLVEEKYLIRDGKTQRDIWGSKLQVDDAVNEVNALLAKEGDCSLDTFYSYAGFNNIPDGTALGWSGGKKLGLTWTTEVRDDGRTVRAFAFRPAPKEGYQGNNTPPG